MQAIKGCVVAVSVEFKFDGVPNARQFRAETLIETDRNDVEEGSGIHDHVHSQRRIPCFESLQYSSTGTTLQSSTFSGAYYGGMGTDLVTYNADCPNGEGLTFR